MQRLALTLIVLFAILSLHANFCFGQVQTKIWDRAFESNTANETPHEVIKASDGGYLILSELSTSTPLFIEETPFSAAAIQKFDAVGNLLWEMRYDVQAVISGISTSDGGFLIGFNDYGATSYDCGIMKLSSTGVVEWEKVFIGTADELGPAVIIPVSGGYVLGTTSTSGAGLDKTDASRGQQDYWVIKIDGSGNKIWDKTYGGSGADELASIVATSDGGFLIGGTTNSPVSGDKTGIVRGSTDNWVLKINSAGVKQWDQTMGYSDADQLVGLFALSDGNYAAIGNAYLFPRQSYKLNRISPAGVWLSEISYRAYDGATLTTVIKTSDNGFLLGGYSASNYWASGAKSENSRGGNDYWVVKIDAAGIKVWDKTLGGAEEERPDGLVELADGYVVAGYSESSLSGDKTESRISRVDLWTVKLTGSGVFSWDKTRSSINHDNAIKSCVKASDGGFFIGSTIGDFSLVKTDAAGAVQWYKAYEGVSASLMSILPAPDGGIIMAGISYYNAGGPKSEGSRGYEDYWVLKVDASGNKVWDKSYGGTGHDNLTKAINTIDGGVLLIGYSDSNAGYEKTHASRGASDFWIVKINANGVKQWDKTFGGSTWETCDAVTQNSDGSFLVGGTSASGISGDKTTTVGSGAVMYWVVKIDAAGNKLWDKSFGGGISDQLVSITGARDNGYFLAGFSQSSVAYDKTVSNRGLNDYWIVRIDGAGTKLWDNVYGTTADDRLHAAVRTSNDGLLLGGSSAGNIEHEKSEASRGLEDYWIVAIDQDGNKLFDKTYGGSSKDHLTGITPVGDWEFMLLGQSLSPVSGDKTEGTANGTYNLWNIRLLSVDVPTVNASGITFPNKFSTRTDIAFAPGNGSKRLVVIKQGSPVDFVPVLDANYSLGSVGGGNIVIANDNISTVTASGLIPNTQYYVKVFEYNEFGSNRFYLPAGSPSASITTLPLPDVFLTTPANAAVNIQVSFSATAKAVSGATTYTLEVSSDPTFATQTIIKTGARTQTFLVPSYSKQYYARVKTNLSPDYGMVTTLNTGTPEFFTKVSVPANGATGVDVSSVSVQAGAVTYATTYTIQISTLSDFSTYMEKSGSRSQTFDPLQLNTLYYARVKTDLSPNWGLTTTFTTADPLALSYVNTPANNSVAQLWTLTVGANPITGATSYTIELAQDAAFTIDVRSETSSSPDIAFSGLAYLTKYYTRVKTNFTPGSWGVVRSFTTDTPVNRSYVATPANNSVDQIWSLNVAASAVTDATTYTIQLCTLDDFSAGVIQMSGSISLPFTGLAHDTKYYTRVSTNLVPGVWGVTRNFTTGNPANVMYVTSPANGAVNVATTVNVQARSLAGLGYTSYTIELNTASDFTGTSIVKTSASRTINFSGLAPATTYYSRVQTNLAPTIWGPVRSFITTSGARMTAPGDDTIEESHLDATKIDLFGNPFKTSLTYQVNTPKNELISVVLFDIKGVKIYGVQETSNVKRVVESSFQSGVYILQVRTSAGTQTLKVIKK